MRLKYCLVLSGVVAVFASSYCLAQNSGALQVIRGLSLYDKSLIIIQACSARRVTRTTQGLLAKRKEGNQTEAVHSTVTRQAHWTR
jgi:hypothetical protein